MTFQFTLLGQCALEGRAELRSSGPVSVKLITGMKMDPMFLKFSFLFNNSSLTLLLPTGRLATKLPQWQM